MRIIVKDLLPGGQYNLQFRSKNGDDVSEWSNTYRVLIGTETSVPETPTNVQLESVGDSFRAKWNAVTLSTDGSPATDLAGYVVRFRNTVTNQTVDFETPDTSFELTYNLNFAAFTPIAGKIGVKIAAKNNMQNLSEWSEEVIAQNPPPEPVKNLVATGQIDSISATWDAPDNLEGDFKEYRVYAATSSGFTPSPANMVWSGVGTTATYYTTTNSDWYIKVVAVDKFDGASTPVTAGPVRPRSSAEVDVDAPDTPTNLDGSISGNALTVTWTAPANPDNDLAGYQIGYRPVGQTGWSYATASHEDTSVTITPITRFVNYETKIQAHDFSFNYSPWSVIETITGEANTAPAVPTGLAVKGAITSAMVVWNANTEDDLYGYEVQWKAGSAPVDSDPVYPTTGRNMSFSENVTQNTLYYARVRAVDTQGLKSAWSAPASDSVGFVDITEVELSDGNPPASSPTATISAGVGSIYANWNPVSNNDSVTYEVHLGTTTGFTPGSATKIGETSSTFTTIQKLPNGSPLVVGTDYYVKLIAKDVDGAAPAGAASNAAATEYVPTEVDLSNLEGRIDDAVTGSVVQYAVNSSETVPPTSGWSTDTPTRTPGSFIWFRTVVTYADGSGSTSNPALLTGNTGETGSPGIPGEPGEDGQSLYTWLKYADTPTTGMSDSPTGKAYMGVAYNKTSPTESTNYEDYTWSLIKGEQGIQGPPGDDGQTTYTWVKYSNSADGTNPVDSPAGMKYIGLAFNKTTATESTNKADYQWSLIQGPKGDTGNTGVSITSITPFYRTETSGSSAPAQPSGTADPAGWSKTEPAYTENTELYRTERILYSNSTAAWTPVTKVASYEAAAAARAIAITADNRVRKANQPPVVGDGANAPVGALWYEYGAATSPGTGTVLKQTWEWTGSTWQTRGIDRTFLPAVDIGTGTFGDLSGARLVANSVKATQIDTDDLTANTAFIDSLKVNAANVQGTLTIGQLDSSVATDSDVATAKSEAVSTANTNADSKVSAAVNPINTLLNNWQAGSGTTYINGGIILTDSIGAGSIRTEEIAADSGFINALTVTNANITSLEANKLTAGSGIINSMTVKSTLTLGDASTNGVIQSHGFSGTTAGFKIDKTGVVINQGTIEARTLKIQSGQNLMRPEYADFEFPDSFYNTTTLTPTNFTTTAVQGGRFNKQSLQLRATATGASSLYLGTTNTDYNIPVESGKVYIISAWVKGGPVASAVQFRIKWSTGTEATLTTSPTSIAANAGWTRFTAVTAAAPSTATGAILSIHCSTSAVNSGFDIDGIQVEEKIGAINTPSAWNSPGATTIDGAMIRTGEIRSSSTVTVNGVSQPMWSINTTGGMQIGSAVIRGTLTVGGSETESQSSIQSYNYVPGTSGFMLRGHDGYAEMQNIKINLSGTAGEIVTGDSGQARVVMSSGGLAGYNASNQQVFGVTGSSTFFAGELRTGITANEGVEILPDASRLGNGIIRFRDPSNPIADNNANISLISSGGGFPEMIIQGPRSSSSDSAAIRLAHLNATDESLMNLDSGAINLTSRSIYINADNSSATAMNPSLRLAAPWIHIDSDTGYTNNGIILEGGEVRIRRGLLKFGGTGQIVSPENSANIDIEAGGRIYIKAGWNGSSGNTLWLSEGATLNHANTYNGTTGSAANVYINSNGRFYRATSVRSAKLNIEPLTMDDPYRVLDLQPVTYVDRVAAEEYAEWLSSDRTDKEAYDDILSLEPHVGLVAEDTQEVGLPGLVTLDNHGNPNGIAYERLAVLLIPVINDLRARVEDLEGQLVAAKSMASGKSGANGAVNSKRS